MVGFGWTVRILAFFNFALQAIAIPFAKERLPHRLNLPLIDMQALRETNFVFYAIGGFLAAFGQWKQPRPYPVLT